MNKPTRPKTLRISRPKTARAVARRAGSLEEFGYNLRDWLHELKRLSTRKQLLEAVRVRPARLGGRFPKGAIADAYLAAQVHALCNRSHIRAPHWVHDPRLVLDDPWFAIPSRHLRPHLLLDTPEEFRRRNVFTVPELTFQVRRGRPAVSDTQKREKARIRQQRYRERLRSRAVDGQVLCNQSGSPDSRVNPCPCRSEPARSEKSPKYSR